MDYFLLGPIGICLTAIGILVRVVGLFLGRKNIEYVGLALMIAGIVAFIALFGIFSDSLSAHLTAMPTSNASCQWVNNSTTSILICQR